MINRVSYPFGTACFKKKKKIKYFFPCFFQAKKVTFPSLNHFSGTESLKGHMVEGNHVEIHEPRFHNYVQQFQYYC